jgi:hypothetical protein
MHHDVDHVSPAVIAATGVGAGVGMVLDHVNRVKPGLVNPNHRRLLVGCCAAVAAGAAGIATHDPHGVRRAVALAVSAASPSSTFVLLSAIRDDPDAITDGMGGFG